MFMVYRSHTRCVESEPARSYFDTSFQSVCMFVRDRAVDVFLTGFFFFNRRPESRFAASCSWPLLRTVVTAE